MKKFLFFGIIVSIVLILFLVGCNSVGQVTKINCIAKKATCNQTGMKCPGYITLSIITCGAGKTCQNGACVTCPAGSCAIGSKKCSENGIQSCLKSNNGCGAWDSAVKNCVAGQTCQNGTCVVPCTDSDGGNNLLIKGTTSGKLIAGFSEYDINGELKSPGQTGTFVDKCQPQFASNALLEFTCFPINGEMLVNPVYTFCRGNDCEDGICVSS